MTTTLQNAKEFSGFVGGWYELHVGERSEDIETVVGIIDYDVNLHPGRHMNSELNAYRESLIA